MQISLEEFQELTEMRENIRRTIEALEVCWSCQKVSECEPAIVDDGPPVWLCQDCARRAQYQNGADPSDAFWTSIR